MNRNQGARPTTPIPNGCAPGDVLELTVAGPAHGGWCVARVAAQPGATDGPAEPDDPGQTERPGEPDGPGKVVFVRHALPGERVRARVTSSTARFARADAIEVLDASPDRVEPPCRYARPGGCGGCDLQHASPAAQRAIKAQVISQQLRRIAGIDRDVEVAALPEPDGAGDPGLGWRTRVGFAVRPDGTAGLRRHRSKEIVAVGDCLIAHQLVRETDVPGHRWPGARGVEVTVSPGSAERSVQVTGQRPASHQRKARQRGAARQPGAVGQRTVAGEQSSRTLTQHAAGRTWRVSPGVFWQVHPAAADVLTDAVLAALQPQAGDVALDLYCGAGLFAGALAAAVGATGRVTAIESQAAAVRDARKNLAEFPGIRVHRGDAAELLGRYGLGDARLAVLDPPRAGATRELIELLAGPDSRLRRVAYVSCDPATLARDIAVFGGLGWELADLRGFDAFPMTHHVECLATLIPG